MSVAPCVATAMSMVVADVSESALVGGVDNGGGGFAAKAAGNATEANGASGEGAGSEDSGKLKRTRTRMIRDEDYEKVWRGLPVSDSSAGCLLGARVRRTHATLRCPKQSVRCAQARKEAKGGIDINSVPPTWYTCLYCVSSLRDLSRARTHSRRPRAHARDATATPEKMKPRCAAE